MNFHCPKPCPWPDDPTGYFGSKRWNADLSSAFRFTILLEMVALSLVDAFKAVGL